MPRSLSPLGPRDRIFLGGHDLEMQEIARLLKAAKLDARVVDRKLAWGARLSQVRRDIVACFRGGGRAVVVELTDDLPRTFDRRGLVVIDHHGKLAGADKPCSLRQIHALLPRPRRQGWTRRRHLVAINDTAHIDGLIAAGASTQEVRAIRDADRKAQGVTIKTERLSRQAVAAARHVAWLAVVETTAPTGSAITDFMHPAYGGPGGDDLFIVNAVNVGFYGRGDVVLALAKSHGGWSGGALPKRGFWGMPRASAPQTETLIDQIVGIGLTP